MKYTEITEDLFNIHDAHALAHCISADFALGKGIAVEFAERFNMKKLLQSGYTDYVNVCHRKRIEGDCIWMNGILNRVTKERYFHKPTYRSMEAALLEMRGICEALNIKRVAMPRIGCGLDGLKWDKVLEVIEGVFQNTDIEIVVCRKEC